jgi:hypothetical protein
MSAISLKATLRYVGAVVAGMLAMTLVVESIEFVSVALIHGTPITDQQIYLSSRNQVPFLLFKLLYNALGGVIGGLLAARIAFDQGARIGLFLAALQGGCLLWAMLSPDLGPMAPTWFWVALILVMTPAIFLGSRIRQFGTNAVAA